MPSLGVITLVALVVVAGLLWFYLRARSKDLVTGIMDKRRAGSKLVSAADYVEGMERIPVALALTNDTFYYENPDLQASFELARVDEIEYDTELAVGRSVAQGEEPGHRADDQQAHEPTG